MRTRPEDIFCHTWTIFFITCNGFTCSLPGSLFQTRRRRYLIDELIDDIPQPLVGKFKGSRTISICSGNHQINKCQIHRLFTDHRTSFAYFHLFGRGREVLHCCSHPLQPAVGQATETSPSLSPTWVAATPVLEPLTAASQHKHQQEADQKQTSWDLNLAG